MASWRARVVFGLGANLGLFSDLQQDGDFRPNSCTSARGMPHTAPFTVPPDIDTEIADSSGWHAYSHRYSTVLSVASSCLQLIPAYSAIAVVCCWCCACSRGPFHLALFAPLSLGLLEREDGLCGRRVGGVLELGDQVGNGAVVGLAPLARHRRLVLDGRARRKEGQDGGGERVRHRRRHGSRR